MIIAWKDKGKPTILISTVCSATSTSITSHQGLENVKPVIVDKYNQSMGDVDRADQYSVYLFL